MAFIEILPLYGKRDDVYLDDKVKIKFPLSNGKQKMHLVLGSLVAKKMGFKHKDKVVLKMDEDNNFLWQLTKGEFGFSLSEHSKHLTFSCTWKYNVPRNYEKYHFCNWVIVDGALQITFAQDQAIKE